MKTKKEIIYAFIDSQNLNLGTSKDIYRGNGKYRKLIYKGWKLDFRKFRKYLFDKFRVSKAFLFIGYIQENKKLYKFLQSSDYELVFKPTVKDDRGNAKGNVDAELIVLAMKFVYEKVCDKTIIISGVGDFAILANFLLEKNKLQKFIVPNYRSMSIQIKKIFVKWRALNLLDSLNNQRDNLEIKKPLYRSGNR